MPKIAPSVLAADFAHLADDLAEARRAGVDMLHLDIMDGHFVPNISFGPNVVGTINKLTELFLDVHLMLSEPEKYFEAFVKAGADAITFHLEVHAEPGTYAEQIRELGVRPGISINPDMDVENVLPHLKHFDYLLLMSVFPGFGGQQFITSVLPKISRARDYVDSNKLDTVIMVDGGVDANNAAEVISAGADILVMGTAFFRSRDKIGLVEKVKKLGTPREAS
ncbi:MAG: ribulose-phosphate 3-epimerase [Candidatus Zixiibacteriota bacterium]|nr:MAG: ribulose-phosphate 3-epimerase [candidate division Zixibacteria bacterium]